MKTIHGSGAWEIGLATGASGAAGRGPAPRPGPADLADVFARHEPRLRAAASRIVRDPEAARDVVQNALVRALQGLAGFRGDSQLGTWLQRIVVNQSLMWLRARRRRARFELALPDDESPAGRRAPSSLVERPDLEQRLDRARALARLGDALAVLSAEDRDVIRHCVVEEEEYARYAARRGLHPRAAKTRAFRARHRLASLMAAREGAPSAAAGAPETGAKRLPR